MKRLDNELLIGKQSAVSEARGLYQMLSTGSTVEELRELIAVPPKIERILRGFALEDPEDAHWIEAAIRYKPLPGSSSAWLPRVLRSQICQKPKKSWTSPRRPTQACRRDAGSVGARFRAVRVEAACAA